METWAGDRPADSPLRRVVFEGLAAGRAKCLIPVASVLRQSGLQTRQQQQDSQPEQSRESHRGTCSD